MTNLVHHHLDFGDHATLLPLSLPCRINERHHNEHGVFYDVRYWWDGEPKNCRVHADELGPVIEKKAVTPS